MIKAIIFDFDGVLVDSELPRFRSVQHVAGKRGITIPDTDFSQLIGKRTRDFLNDVIAAEKKEELVEQIIAEHDASYKANIAEHVEEIKHTTTFIKNYSGFMRFAIASGSAKKTIETLLEHFGIIKKFSVIVSNDDVTHLKPDPEIYLKVLEQLHLFPHECVVVEDLVIGAQAAIKANIPCYVFLNGTNSEKDFDGMSIAGFLRSEEDFKKLV